MEAFGLALYIENGMRNNPLKRGFLTLPRVAISFNLTASSESSES
jgi:hypothetical protein